MRSILHMFTGVHTGRARYRMALQAIEKLTDSDGNVNQIKAIVVVALHER